MRDDGYFDERVAARYDETYDYQAVPEVIEPVLDLLAELAGEGRALELGVGTLAIGALASGVVAWQVLATPHGGGASPPVS